MTIPDLAAWVVCPVADCARIVPSHEPAHGGSCITRDLQLIGDNEGQSDD